MYKKSACKVATLPKSYLIVKGIIMQSLKSIGQSQNKLTVTDGRAKNFLETNVLEILKANEISEKNQE